MTFIIKQSNLIKSKMLPRRLIFYLIFLFFYNQNNVFLLNQDYFFKKIFKNAVSIFYECICKIVDKIKIVICFLKTFRVRNFFFQTMIANVGRRTEKRARAPSF